MTRSRAGQPDAPSSGGAESPVLSVPDHQLLRCIGRGSYGRVWLARSVLGALRAVKIVERSSFRDARPYEREFTGILRIEPLSRAHDGLIDILHVGRHEPEGFFYYVMELADPTVEGVPPDTHPEQDIARYAPRTLAFDLKQRGRLPFEECVQLGLRISSALSHIHQNGLVHRDVKPSNILYVNGVPKLGDIGLVGDAGESASYVGTEGYIPPEGPGSAQADVFGLGKMLYEACTGRDRQEFPQLPLAIGEGAARSQLAELNEVILKACAPDPHRRYASTEDLHADLALLHRGQSVLRQRKARRRWRLARVGLNAAALLAGLLLGALWSPLQWVPSRAGGDSAGTRLVKLPEQKPVDLLRFYNAALTNNWLEDFEGNDLASLPASWSRFGPAYFQANGIIQLAGTYTEQRRLLFPAAVEGIPVNRKCIRLHFLHGTAWVSERSVHVASYVMHYRDGRREEIPLRYGEELEDWWWEPKQTLICSQATLAWLGTNFACRSSPSRIRLYSITWNNPYPEVAIDRLDFVSTGSSSCPFLVAVTAE